MNSAKSYRGRIAPTPTGFLHLGHAATFLRAEQHARAAGGKLILRIEDLDTQRCKPEYAAGAIEDLQQLGIRWDDGPFYQSRRLATFEDVWRKLKNGGFIYPCRHSRKDVENAANAPHAEDDEAIFPPELRPPAGTGRDTETPAGTNWRFRVPDGERIRFADTIKGEQQFTAGEDFGDFVVWRRDNVPAYELAVVADDIAMGITEVVRGEDLLKSTARQILLYRALGLTPPAWAHAPLICDESGKRLAKRNAALSIRALFAGGLSPEQVRAKAGFA